MQSYKSSNQEQRESCSMGFVLRRCRVWRMAVVCAMIPLTAFSSRLSTHKYTKRKQLIMSPEVGDDCSAPWSSTCFDRSRCVGPDGLQKLTIYAHDFNCTNAPSGEIMARKEPIRGYLSSPNAGLKAFREFSLERGILEEKVEDACIIVYAVGLRSQCVYKTAEWNSGRNHLLVDWGDQPRGNYKDLKSSSAMWAQANTQARYFRYGYDIAVPFPPKVEFDNLASLSPTHRKYFATFKGTLYPSGSGREERNATRQLGLAANSPDVVIVEICHELHQEHLLPENLELCQNLKEEYSQKNYADLMNTTFALIPSGRSPATYRLGEALSAGAIPVFFNNGFVKPFPGQIPWRLCSFSFSIDDSAVVIDTLRAVPEETLLFMQATALQVYDEYFKHGMNDIVKTVVETLESRLSFRSERKY